MARWLVEVLSSKKHLSQTNGLRVPSSISEPMPTNSYTTREVGNVARQLFKLGYRRPKDLRKLEPSEFTADFIHDKMEIYDPTLIADLIEVHGSFFHSREVDGDALCDDVEESEKALYKVQVYVGSTAGRLLDNSNSFSADGLKSSVRLVEEEKALGRQTTEVISQSNLAQLCKMYKKYSALLEPLK